MFNVFRPLAWHRVLEVNLFCALLKVLAMAINKSSLHAYYYLFACWLFKSPFELEF